MSKFSAANLKAQRFSKCSIPPTFTRTVVHNGQVVDLEITIQRLSITTLPNGRQWLTVEAEAKRDGTRLRVDNPLHFQNPPVLVLGGKEDLNESIRLMVVECIRATCLS